MIHSVNHLWPRPMELAHDADWKLRESRCSFFFICLAHKSEKDPVSAWIQLRTQSVVQFSAFAFWRDASFRLCKRKSFGNETKTSFDINGRSWVAWKREWRVSCGFFFNSVKNKKKKKCERSLWRNISREMCVYWVKRRMPVIIITKGQREFWDCVDGIDNNMRTNESIPKNIPPQIGGADDLQRTEIASPKRDHEFCAVTVLLLSRHFSLSSCIVFVAVQIIFANKYATHGHLRKYFHNLNSVHVVSSCRVLAIQPFKNSLVLPLLKLNTRSEMKKLFQFGYLVSHLPLLRTCAPLCIQINPKW